MPLLQSPVSTPYGKALFLFNFLLPPAEAMLMNSWSPGIQALYWMLFLDLTHHPSRTQTGDFLWVNIQILTHSPGSGFLITRCCECVWNILFTAGLLPSWYLKTEADMVVSHSEETTESPFLEMYQVKGEIDERSRKWLERRNFCGLLVGNFPATCSSLKLLLLFAMVSITSLRWDS